MNTLSVRLSRNDALRVEINGVHCAAAKWLDAHVESIPDGYDVRANFRYPRSKPGRVTYALSADDGHVIFRTHRRPQRIETADGITYTWQTNKALVG